MKSLIKKLDSIIVDLGGKIYLTKDALMDKKTFRKTYLNIKEFEKIREKYYAKDAFTSLQSQRLGIQ